jgi:hypothetical protein
MSNQSIPIQYDEPGPAFRDPPLFNFVYCSQVKAGLGSADVDNIVATSRRRNRVQGITGLLVFGSGVFFQWIEGPKANVMSLVKLIETDSRHEMMVTLSTDEEVRERIFPAWDMELVGADDIQEVLQDALQATQDRRSIDALQLLLDNLQTHAQ